ncbi:MAG: glycosyltransferase family 4 protein [Gammaproteobacteria bacterium]|nr:glycosyltransferase family 4 protein [Gammaproteobacteria bacterium]
MNILHCCFSKGWGGLEMYPIRLYPFIQNESNDILYLVYKGSKLEHELTDKQLPFVALNPKTPLLVRLYQIIKLIKKHKSDLIHCHKSGDLFYAVATHYFHQARIVFTEHMGGKRNKKDLYHRWIYRNVSRLFSISNEVKRRNINALPINPNKVFTLHLGLDLNFYQMKLSHSDKQNLKRQLSLPLNKTLIGLPGRLTPGKGHDVFIKAAAILLQTHAELAFVIIGGTKADEGADLAYIEKLKTVITENNLGSQFYFTGFQTNIPAIVESLDIACVPSDNEAFGLTVIEVMAMNTPLVASNAGGIPELLRHQQDGLLMRPKDQISLAEQLKILLEAPQLAEQYAASAHQRIIQHFSQTSHAEKLLQHYDDILSL